MSAPTALLVPALPGATSAPLVLVDGNFLANLAGVEQRVGALAIKDAETFQNAGALLNELTVTTRALEDARTKLKTPFLELGRRIDACAKAPATRLETLLRKVRTEIATYNQKQVEERNRIERERQAEIQRLEAEQRRQQAEADKKAKELAATAAPSDLDFDEAPPAAPKSVLEQKIETLKFTPAAPVAKAEGIAFRVTLVAQVADVAKLPDAFVIRSANERLIRETYCVGYKDGQPLPELPGVVFKVDRVPVSTGRAGTTLY